MPNSPEPQRPRVYQLVIEHIERELAAGTYPYGGQLPSERALMEQLGVGRTAVREALFALQTKGFVTLSPGARARVTRPVTSTVLAHFSGAARSLLEQPQGMSHFQEARSLFECSIARHAARHATPKQIELLRIALETNRRDLASPEAFAASDMAFHLVLAEIPNNPIFTALHGALSQWLIGQRQAGLRVRGSVRIVLKDHERIFDAVLKHDPDGAEAAMMVHLTNVAGFFWKAVEAGR